MKCSWSGRRRAHRRSHHSLPDVVPALDRRIGHLGFEFLDATLELLDDRGDRRLGEAPVDVLRAVHVPRLHLEDDRPLDLAGIAGVSQGLDQPGIPLDHPSRAPDLDPPPLGVVHQEEERPRVLREVAQRDVLAVAAEVGEGERPLVQDLQEAGRAAPVLDVRLALGVRRPEVEHVEAGEERLQLRRDGRLPAGAPLHAGVGGTGALLHLDGLHGGREGHVAGIPSHDLPSGAGGGEYTDGVDVGPEHLARSTRDRRLCSLETDAMTGVTAR